MTSSPAARQVRILLCDDHAVVRAGLHALLSGRDDMTIVGEAASGEEALAVAARVHPDVILMDLKLEGGSDGIATTRQLLNRAAADPSTPTPRVLVLTMFDTDADITRALKWRHRLSVEGGQTTGVVRGDHGRRLGSDRPLRTRHGPRRTADAHSPAFLLGA